MLHLDHVIHFRRFLLILFGIDLCHHFAIVISKTVSLQL